MSKLVFYHQKRADGGMRTGVEIDDERLLETFEPGKEPQDSKLLWFVDVRCSGGRLPSEPDTARKWFLERGEIVRTGLRQLAEELRAGIDSDWPGKKEIPNSDGVSMAIYYSAMRRFSGRDISGVLFDLAENWPRILQEMGSYEHPIPVHG